MSSSTIEWTDKTWNPVVGCSPASHGCDHCYAAGVANRAMQAAHKGLTVVGVNGPEFNGTVRCLPDRLGDPLKWQKPCRVFVNSMSDLFHPAVSPAFVASVFATAALAGRHTFQVLTKRPQRMASVLGSDGFVDQIEDAIIQRHPRAPLTADGSGFVAPGVWDLDGMDWPLPNVWLGTSIESDRYTFRANHLRETPAAVRFLSLEPLLGPLPSLDLAGIDWVIVGGESGGKARPMDPAWVRDVRDQCEATGTAFFFKQAGRVLAKQWRMSESKGKHLDEMPADLRIRNMPAEVA